MNVASKASGDGVGNSQQGSGHDGEDTKIVKSLQIKVQQKHLDMLKEIAKSYRIPHNISHSIRLMIEDKFSEIGEVSDLGIKYKKGNTEDGH